MKRSLLIFTVIFFMKSTAIAVEGMWIPSLIEMFHSDMQTYGLKLSPEDIYSTNNSSLKDAIIQFNGGCTAEIVSNQGLILTNHHCGFDAIQKHSSLENDYLKNGFWSKNFSEELPCPWLRVTFVREIRDVTDQVLEGITDQTAKNDIPIILEKNITTLENEAKQGNLIAKIKPFNQGNQYFMLITEDFNDIRLVGAPPSAIGKYGGDTDNWVWPRHTGDFSVFRIYAGAENKSAKYDETNVPYKPDYSLPISLKPKQVGDFTMVYGFPGHTDQHYTSRKLKFIIEKERPARIDMRQHSLDIIKPAMNADDQIRIQYASKQARIANAWKKWIGQLGGLKELNAIEKKIAFEEVYRAKAAEQSEWKHKYYDVINELNILQEKFEEFEFARSMFIEYFYMGPEFIQFAFDFYGLANNWEKFEKDGKLQDEINTMVNKSISFFRNYNKELDYKIYKSLTPLYISYVSENLLPLEFADTWEKNGEKIFEKSVILNEEKLAGLLTDFNKKSAKKLAKDPALGFAVSLYMAYINNVSPVYRDFVIMEEELMQRYVEGLIVMFPDKNIWPDANSTMRIAYGKVDGSAPYDGMKYLHYTTIDGVMQKYDPNNPDFQLPQRFIDLYNEGDWGGYDQDGDLWVCFTASNHTTGGNSGSPVIDSEGSLMGINFDRSWESTMSDFMFDESRCRNIIVDIRYVLWVIDKYGEAGHLIEEMELVGI